MKDFKLAALLGLSLAGAHSLAQNCVIPAPQRPPTPTRLIVYLPADGGGVGCTVAAIVPGGANPTEFPIGNVKCAQSVAIAAQSAANDNGWNDGGTP